MRYRYAARASSKPHGFSSVACACQRYNIRMDTAEPIGMQRRTPWHQPSAHASRPDNDACLDWRRSMRLLPRQPSNIINGKPVLPWI